MSANYTVRNLLIRELESLRVFAAKGKGPFKVEEIDAELKRRADLKRCSEPFEMLGKVGMHG